MFRAVNTPGRKIEQFSPLTICVRDDRGRAVLGIEPHTLGSMVNALTPRPSFILSPHDGWCVHGLV